MLFYHTKIRSITAGMLAALLLALGCATAFAQEETDLQVPQIRVVTEDGNGTELQKDDGYVDADVTITDIDGTTLEKEASFKVRGNTTALSWVLKKAFTFKFEKKTDVLGMGKGKKWALNNTRKPDATYEANFAYLKNWYNERHTWLSSYFALSEPVHECGDTNGDGRIDITDATLVQRYVAKLDTAGFEQFLAADVNADGAADISDCTQIQLHAAGLIDTFS